ncbi:disulfide bond formation protein DsbB [Palleronia aestuarii]|uniref:Disulfide bond formation protein DsbB n=1 Tax=Palleronia aestuarii TaxID=568105 RepID=A0A2W7P3G5_9RHOB|nr:disulfide bond formation protein B [Palleronia aestuarii]PZX19956.1 disulfide bond formation protein DsbB [Palleronia aestuarii]
MSVRGLMVAAAFGSVLLLGGAFLFQSLGYAPCQMCLWQRWPHMVAIALGVVAVFWSRWPVALGGTLALLTTAGLGLYHTGVEKDWWQGPTSCSGGSSLGNLSGADLLSADVVDRVVMCNEVSWAFAGLSMASWNAILSLCLALVWAVAMLRLLRAPSLQGSAPEVRRG